LGKLSLEGMAGWRTRLIDTYDMQNPSPEKPDEIRRTQRATASPAHLSRFPQIGLNQGATEQIILDHLEASSSLHVERNIMLETLRVDDHECDDDDAYPVHATLRRLSDHERAANRASRGGSVLTQLESIG